MSYVFLVDTFKQPLDPIRPGWARKLLKAGKASVLRRFPFTLILKREVKEPILSALRFKIDPGSKTTRIAVLKDSTGEVLFGAEIEHRGQKIKDALDSRRAYRRNRRNRHTRYREPRFNNRTRLEGWLPPSIGSRIENVLTWVKRILRISPIKALSQELVKFDTQLLQSPEIAGVLYQQGELQGYEVREYLLEKFKRLCAYCGKGNVPLEIEHIVPSSRGGSDRVSNLTLACHNCNETKGTKTAEEFGHSEVQKLAKAPLKDAASMNATRWELYRRLQKTGLPLEVGSGGLTKYNRIQRRLDKEHWIDAVCVGISTPARVEISQVKVLKIKAFGHGRRQRCRVNAFGFPIGYAPKEKSFRGFQTGDFVKAVITKGKFAGVHLGRVAIRFRPSFRLNGFDVHPKYLTILQKADGYNYF
ncbi:MAG: RNA-guided endonuclease IscB [Planctomycetota bacterium]